MMMPTSHLGIQVHIDATAKIRGGWEREGWWTGKDGELPLPVYSGAAAGAQKLHVGLKAQSRGPLSARRNAPNSLHVIGLASQNA